MTAAPCLGISETFLPGDEARVAAAILRLRALGVRHLRLPLSPADEAWNDWLLQRLSPHFDLLPVIAGDAAAAFVERFRAHLAAVELPFTTLAAAADALAVMRALRMPAVLGGLSAGDLPGLPGGWAALGLRAFPAGGGFDWAAAARGAAPDCPVWITEVGYSTRRHDGVVQARVFRDALRAPVERLYWRGLQDRDDADPREGQFGLDDAAGQPKLLARLLAAGMTELEQVLALPAPAISRRRPVLVTGGAGFIGSNLVDRLASDGHDVLVFDALARPGVERNLRWLSRRHPARVSFAIADLRDGAALSESAGNAAAVFHLAGQVAVTTSMAQPVADFEVNAAGTLALLEALRRKNPSAPLVFASTNKVYGDLADIALARSQDRYLPSDPALRARGVSEARPLQFHTPYGCSKGAADQYVLDYAHSFGLHTAVLRMSCIYGERQLGTEDQGWVAHFLLKAIAGEAITIYGDGAQVRDVLHVGDAIAAYLSAWQRIGKVSGRAYNLGGGPANAISLLQLIEHIETLVGRKLDVTFADWRPGDQRYFVADTQAARRDLGLAAPLDWRVGVARLSAHFGAPNAAAQMAEAAS